MVLYHGCFHLSLSETNKNILKKQQQPDPSWRDPTLCSRMEPGQRPLGCAQGREVTQAELSPGTQLTSLSSARQF